MKIDSTPNGEHFCGHCGTKLEPLTVLEIGNVKRPFGAKRCTCSEAQAYWTERDAMVERDNREREAKERKERLDKLFRQSLLPERWKRRSFEAFQRTEDNEGAYQRCLTYAQNFDSKSNKGIWFTGDVGRGKTHLCAAVAMHLIEREYSVIFGTVTQILGQIRNTYDSDKENEQMVFQRLTRCQLLIIDDLGKEKVTEWVEQMVYDIINARYENDKPILVTTNMSIPTIVKKYSAWGDHGNAIMSRGLEMCDGIKMIGPDWRRKGMSE